MITPDYQLPERMDRKMRAIPFPDLQGKAVLDIGCDMGFWCKFALANGAGRVVGLDRGRLVKNVGMVDLAAYCHDTITDSRAEFYQLNLGKQYRDYGRFDVAFLFSLYHHIFEAAGGDHEPIWYWLARHVKPGGVVLWENPIDTRDPVVQMNVTPANRVDYNQIAILSHASKYFEVEYIGPAIHEPTRDVFKFTRRIHAIEIYDGDLRDGAGGATAAFRYADNRRCREIHSVLGYTPFPGSLNVRTVRNFDWEHGYYRAQLLDVATRSMGLDSEWKLRWARFYPVTLYGGAAYAFRFEGESYGHDFVELIADRRLRDTVPPHVRLYR